MNDKTPLTRGEWRCGIDRAAHEQKCRERREHIENRRQNHIRRFKTEDPKLSDFDLEELAMDALVAEKNARTEAEIKTEEAADLEAEIRLKASELVDLIDRIRVRPESVVGNERGRLKTVAADAIAMAVVNAQQAVTLRSPRR